MYTVVLEKFTFVTIDTCKLVELSTLIINVKIIIT